ncbi:MAG: phosphatase PAP2 family protein [Actinobacteria bacterium]|nr:phosphatase PAP2 family protein [Actinomycetota bacterium]
MSVVLALLAVAGVLGVVASTVVARWPDYDPAAPHLLWRWRRRRVDPELTTGVALTLCVPAVVVFTAAAGVLLLMVRTKTGIANYDLAFARWGAVHATSGSTTVLRRLSDLGGTLGVVSLAVIVGIIEFRRLPNRAIPALLALTVLGQFAIVNLIKVIVDRARPDLSQLTGFSSSSFPSGHATSAAATFAVIALLVGRRRSRPTRAAITGGAVAIAATVAGTRVLLGVHWLTDVLAGLAIGWAWFALCSVAFGGRLLHFGAPASSTQGSAPV